MARRKNPDGSVRSAPFSTPPTAGPYRTPAPEPRKKEKAKDQRKIVRRTKTVFAGGAAEVPEVYEWQYTWGRGEWTPSFVLTVDGGKYIAVPDRLDVRFKPTKGSREPLGRFTGIPGDVQKAVRRHMRGETTVWQRIKKALQLNPAELEGIPTPGMKRAWVKKVAKKHNEPMPNPGFIDWLFGIDDKHVSSWVKFYTRQGSQNRKLIQLFKDKKVPYRNLGYDKASEIFTLGVDLGFVDTLKGNNKRDVLEGIDLARVRPTEMAPGVVAWNPEPIGDGMGPKPKTNSKKKSRKSLSRGERAAILRRVTGAR